MAIAAHEKCASSNGYAEGIRHMLLCFVVVLWSLVEEYGLTYCLSAGSGAEHQWAQGGAQPVARAAAANSGATPGAEGPQRGAPGVLSTQVVIFREVPQQQS